jgi:hypothetical protein
VQSVCLCCKWIERRKLVTRRHAKKLPVGASKASQVT